MNRFGLKLMLVLFSGIILFSCKTKEDDSTQVIENAVVEGKWTISYYYDKTKDETSDFSGYVFEFKNDGELIAEKSGATTSGTWSIKDESNDDSKDDHTEFVIYLGSDEPLVELNDDWHVVENSENSLKLEDESGSGGIEKLHFKKQ